MTLEEKLLAELRAVPDIVVEPSSDSYVTLIEARYPFAGSKIDWDKVPGCRGEHVELERFLEDADRFTEQVLASEGIDRASEVVVIGDGPIDAALRMSLSTLQACLSEIVNMPQHTYVIPPDASWCLVYTMEGDLCFGYAPA